LRISPRRRECPHPNPLPASEEREEPVYEPGRVVTELTG